MKCMHCQEIGIKTSDLRDHLEQHNPNARGMEYSEVREQFELDPEAKVPICRYCGSEDIRKDADATWDVESQQWELNAVYDSVVCQACGEQSNFTGEKEVEA